MPFTLGLTEDDKRAANNAAIRLSNLRGVDIRNKSYLYALFVLEEAKNMTRDELLFANAYDEIEYLADIISGVRFPAATAEWSQDERDIHLARCLLSLAYLENVQKWITTARLTMRRWRIDAECHEETPELPKVGWQQRDLIERALGDLDNEVSLSYLPATWAGHQAGVPSLLRLVAGEGEGSEDDSSNDDSSDDESSDDESSDDESGGESSDDDSSDDEGTDDDFEIVIRGSRLNEPFRAAEASAPPESDESRRIQGGSAEIDIDEEVTGFDYDGSESEDSELWDSPNVEQGTGRFVNGRYIEY